MSFPIHSDRPRLVITGTVLLAVAFMAGRLIGPAQPPCLDIPTYDPMGAHRGKPIVWVEERASVILTFADSSRAIELAR